MKRRRFIKTLGLAAASPLTAKLPALLPAEAPLVLNLDDLLKSLYELKRASEMELGFSCVYPIRYQYLYPISDHYNFTGS